MDKGKLLTARKGVVNHLKAFFKPATHIYWKSIYSIFLIKGINEQTGVILNVIANN